jgi:hypothetical protein
MSEQPTSESLETRLERWEYEKRQLLGLGVAVLTLSAGLALYASGWGHRPKAIEATSFVIRDRDGRVRGRLGVHKDGSPELALLDSRGRDQMLLHTFPDDTAALYLYDKGRVRLALTAAPNGGAAVNMFDPERDRSAGLYVDGDGTTGVAFRDGKQQTHLTAKSGETGDLRLVDQTVRPAVRAPRRPVSQPTPLAAPVRPPAPKAPAPVRTSASPVLSASGPLQAVVHAAK